MLIRLRIHNAVYLVPQPDGSVQRTQGTIEAVLNDLLIGWETSVPREYILRGNPPGFDLSGVPLHSPHHIVKAVNQQLQEFVARNHAHVQENPDAPRYEILELETVPPYEPYECGFARRWRLRHERQQQSEEAPEPDTEV